MSDAISAPPAKQPLLDELLEEAQDHLQLQMLLIEVASSIDQADFGLIARAYYFAAERHAGQKRSSGEPFLQHCVEVARILAQLRLDATTVAAGLLHDVLEDTDTSYSEIGQLFGDKVATLIDGVTKIERYQYKSREARQAETYRKMLLSMVEDIRVILIKFADRLHNMRTLDHLKPAQQQRIAHETTEVYAPLAHRLGLARVRWELEDRSLKYLEPEIYQEIREKVAMKRQERENYIEEFKLPIDSEMKKNGIDAEITGRAKNFFSIANKMKSRGKPFEEIYDLLAVRIMVPTIRECYHVLGLVHTLYHPIPDRFKDYIATPKSNMYQSLHTSVIGPQGLPVEIQLRTWDMHFTAEIGIAAHWRYKAGTSSGADLEARVDWIRQVLDWQRDAKDPKEFMENLKIELFHDEIFVFTPKGDLHQLPKGATPLDFAFSIHTDIGLHCLSAKVNDQVVPLSSALNSGDTVRIVTSPTQKPRSSWLEQIKTNKARQAVRRWIKEEHFSHSERLGRDMVERELKRHRRTVSQKQWVKVAEEMGYSEIGSLFAAIGSGEIPSARLLSLVLPPRPRRQTSPQSQDRRGILIQGMDDMAINFGKCCTPIPGDPVIGYLTRGRGVSVHRTDCPNLADLAGETERLIPVQWDWRDEQAFTVKLSIKGFDRPYLLSEIAQVVGDVGASIRSLNATTIENMAVDYLWVDVRDTAQLTNLSGALEKLKDVTEVKRISGEQASPDKSA
jgi:GTP diphosphokinase / guanosine-3',5'-bis(diphosphate) 3'-diphosphatase